MLRSKRNIKLKKTLKSYIFQEKMLRSKRNMQDFKPHIFQEKMLRSILKIHISGENIV